MYAGLHTVTGSALSQNLFCVALNIEWLSCKWLFEQNPSLGKFFLCEEVDAEYKRDQD